MVTKNLQILNLKFDQVMFNSLVLTWERNFEVTFGIFSVLVFQISVLESSWLTASIQIVKSLSLCYKKSYFFNMVQPIDLIFCKMIKMIKQNIFNRADFSFKS